MRERPFISRTTLLYGAVLIAISLAQYSYSLRNDFVMDSVYAFKLNPSVRELSNIPSFFTGAGPKSTDPFEANSLVYFRPLLNTVRTLEYQAFGENPMGYNSVNIIINALVVLLAFMLVREVSGSRSVAFWAALLYSVNPVRVEAVSWAYSDAYIMAGALSLGCIILYIRKRFGLSLFLFMLSILTFEGSLLLIPAMAMLPLATKPGSALPDPAGYRWPAIWPFRWLPAFLIVALLYLGLRRYAVGPAPITSLALPEWLNGAALIMASCMKMVFIPDGPIALYIYRPGMFQGMGAATSYAAVLLAMGAGVYFFRRQRTHLFWLLWFFLWPSVFLNMGRFGEFYLNEKILYLASLGPCVIIVSYLSSIKRQQVFRALLVTMVLAHFSLTYSRTLNWTGNDTYMTAARRAAPDSVFVHNWFGRDYAGRGMYAEARTEYEASLGLFYEQGVVHLNLGNIQYIQGETEKGLASWKESIRFTPLSPEPYNNLCVILNRTGRAEQAREYCEAFERITPHQKGKQG